MRALVTGGAGFIGSHVVDYLLDKGYDVIVMDNFSTGSMDNLPDGIEPVIIHTIGSNDPLPEGLKFDTLVHLAAPVSVEESLTDAKRYFTEIAYGTDKLMKWAICCGCENFVLASTAAVYGDNEELPLNEESLVYPQSPYASAKLLMEDMARAYKEHNVMVLRFFNVYGERQRNTGGYVSAIPIFKAQVENGHPVTVTGDGEQTRDFVYVKDVAAAIYKSIGSHAILNIGSGKEYKVIDIAKAFSDNIKFIAERNEIKRSKADVYAAYFWLSWEPETDLFNWIKSIK
tara:strand:- start:75 stop:935 length:861 start_codon:yes stop_codon:yes gene_type:complete